MGNIALPYAFHALSAALIFRRDSRKISLDISRAFDRIWHKGLFVKLPMFALHHTVVTWIASFPSGNSIAVKVDGFLSRGPCVFWKVMEIDSTVFQDRESFWKKSFSKLLSKSFGFLFGAILKYP